MMTEKPPAALDRMWDNIPAGDAPIGDLLTAGRTAKRRQRRRIIAGVAAVTALVVGGGVLTQTVLNRPDSLVADGGPSKPTVTVLVSEPAKYGMQALGGGRIEVVGGCLGASGSVIVWPHGTEVVKHDPLTIDIPTYGTFSLGDEVEVAGGFVLEHSSDDVKPGPYQVGGVTVPAECAKHDIFVAN